MWERGLCPCLARRQSNLGSSLFCKVSELLRRGLFALNGKGEYLLAEGDGELNSQSPRL